MFRWRFAVRTAELVTLLNVRYYTVRGFGRVMNSRIKINNSRCASQRTRGRRAWYRCYLHIKLLFCTVGLYSDYLIIARHRAIYSGAADLHLSAGTFRLVPFFFPGRMLITRKICESDERFFHRNNVYPPPPGLRILILSKVSFPI